MPEKIQRLFEGCDRLAVGTAGHGFLAGFMKVFYGLVPQLAA
jgi:hypothetical protein